MPKWMNTMPPTELMMKILNKDEKMKVWGITNIGCTPFFLIKK